MLLEKLCYMKTNTNFRDQAWNIPSAKYWAKDFVLSQHHVQNFY